jgi:hypothetical protein
MFWFFQNLGIKEFLIPILKKENQNQKNLQGWFFKNTLKTTGGFHGN